MAHGTGINETNWFINDYDQCNDNNDDCVMINWTKQYVEHSNSGNNNNELD